MGTAVVADAAAGREFLSIMLTGFLSSLLIFVANRDADSIKKLCGCVDVSAAPF